MAEEARILQLLINRLEGALSESEQVELDAWIDSAPANRFFMETQISLETITEDLRILLEMDEQSLDQKVWAGIETAKTSANATAGPILPPLMPSGQMSNRKRILRRVGVIAACFLLAIGAFQLYEYRTASRAPSLFSKDRKPILDYLSKLMQQEVKNPTLFIGSDSFIYLNNLPEGRLRMQGDHKIVKRSDNNLAFLFTQFKFTNLQEFRQLDIDSTYDAISLPLGSPPWDIILPDSSIVTLYPGSFVGFKIYLNRSQPTQRIVAMSGTALFKVSHNHPTPFTVETNQLEMMATGTEFLVTDPGPKDIYTLLQYSGSLDFTDGNQRKKLDSAQRASRDIAHKSITIDAGITLPPQKKITQENFDFSERNLPSALKELAHWYGITYIYVDPELDTITPGTLSMGQVPKNLPLPELLEQLEKQTKDMHFSADDKIISVTKQTPSGRDQTR